MLSDWNGYIFVGFSEKYRKYIVAGSTLAAAAAVLLLALGVNSIRNKNYAPASDSYETADSYEAGDSYDGADMDKSEAYEETAAESEYYEESAAEESADYADAVEEAAEDYADNAAEMTEATTSESADAELSIAEDEGNKNSVIMKNSKKRIITSTDSYNIDESDNATYSIKSEEAETAALTVGSVAPDFTAEVSGGGSFKLSEQSGKIVVLNVWATWCGPCVEELSAIDKLSADAYDDLEIICINCSEDEKTVDDFVTENAYSFDFAYDTDGKIGEMYPTESIPYTLIIKDGKIQEIFTGTYEADEQYLLLKQAVDSLY